MKHFLIGSYLETAHHILQLLGKPCQHERAPIDFSADIRHFSGMVIQFEASSIDFEAIVILALMVSVAAVTVVDFEAMTPAPWFMRSDSLDKSDDECEQD